MNDTRFWAGKAGEVEVDVDASGWSIFIFREIVGARW